MGVTYFRNNNDHGVSMGGSRVPARSVGAVSNDEDASVIEGYDGVEKVSAKDAKSALEEQRDAGSLSAESKQRLAELEAGELRVAARAALVSAPLQVVVGDDDAPLGPPTGTVTTKQLAAEEGPVEKRAFADHEHAEVPEGASEIEHRQAEKVRVVEEVAQKLAADKDGATENSTSPDAADDQE